VTDHPEWAKSPSAPISDDDLAFGADLFKAPAKRHRVKLRRKPKPTVAAVDNSWVMIVSGAGSVASTART
jgi:hypothetical protein